MGGGPIPGNLCPLPRMVGMILPLLSLGYQLLLLAGLCSPTHTPTHTHTHTICHQGDILRACPGPRGLRARAPLPGPAASPAEQRHKFLTPKASPLPIPLPARPHSITKKPLSCRSTGEFFETKPIIIEATGLHKPCSPSWPLLLDPSESRSKKATGRPWPSLLRPEGGSASGPQAHRSC